MPSNDELIKAIQEIDENASTEGNNEELAKRLSELRNDGENTRSAPAPRKKKAKAELPKLKQGQARVARGRAITTKKGIVAWPGGVSAKDLSGGDKAFKNLMNAELLEK